jgi:SAM-dependent methyltransferase
MKLTDLQKHWNEFGKRDAMWAILTAPDKTNGRWEAGEFFAQGRLEIDRVIHTLQASDIPFNQRRALDFGCGVGRLTQALCNHFQECHGVDIAPSMIQQAKQYNQHGERCHYHVNDRADLRLFADSYFDFVYSVIVLQHMQPVYSLAYVGEFMRVLAPGGLLYFQIPSHRMDDPTPWRMAEQMAARPNVAEQPTGWWARTSALLRGKVAEVEAVAAPRMEMYGVYKELMVERLEQCGGVVLDVQPDAWAGEAWVSYTYCVGKGSPHTERRVAAPESLQRADPAAVTSALEQITQQVDGFAAALESERGGFDHWVCLPAAAYQGKDVLDVGCGLGAASALFLQRGARSVWGIDPLLTSEQFQALRLLPNATFCAAPLDLGLFGEQRFDLVYARFVTEHLPDLAGAFVTLFQLLRPGGRLVALHDNYYSPLGAQDHAFVWPVNEQSRLIDARGPKCWQSPQKCSVSEAYRQEIAQRYDGSLAQWQLTPDDCTQCPYYQRSQPWGHLLYQEQFSRLYVGPAFQSKAANGLNKVTPFQLKQYLLEAGFRLTHWESAPVKNNPAQILLSQFSEADLCTNCILLAAQRPKYMVGSNDGI